MLKDFFLSLNYVVWVDCWMMMMFWINLWSEIFFWVINFVCFMVVGSVNVNCMMRWWKCWWYLKLIRCLIWWYCYFIDWWCFNSCCVRRWWFVIWSCFWRIGEGFLFVMKDLLIWCWLICDCLRWIVLMRLCDLWVIFNVVNVFIVLEFEFEMRKVMLLWSLIGWLKNLRSRCEMELVCN